MLLQRELVKPTPWRPLSAIFNYVSYATRHYCLTKYRHYVRLSGTSPSKLSASQRKTFYLGIFRGIKETKIFIII